RSITPGRKPSTRASAFASKFSTCATASLAFRSSSTTLRPRPAIDFRFFLAPTRSSVTTSAPISANIMQAKGPGPMPANSTIRNPASGPEVRGFDCAADLSSTWFFRVKALLAGGGDRSLRHHLDQIGAIVCRTMDIAQQPGRGNGEVVERARRPVRTQGLLDRRQAHDAALGCAGGGDADVAGFGFGDEHPGEGKARRRMREFGIARLGRYRKRHGGDDFAVFQCGREQAFE